MSFYSERNISAIRKPRQCCGCASMLMAGDAALKCSGVNYDNDFWYGTYHHECRAAEEALNKAHDTRWDEWMSLLDMEWDDYPWLLEEFPSVAVRMNITQERYEAIRDEQERCRLFFAEQQRKREEERQAELAKRRQANQRIS